MRNRALVCGLGLGLIAGMAPSVEAESASAQAQVLIIIPERRTPPSIAPAAPPHLAPSAPAGLPHAVAVPRVTDPGITASLTSDGTHPVILYTKIQ